MKDSKFIELLNLYVDHEISAADVALLEAEIQQNPKRRQVYREYCQMQKACVLLTDKFRTEAPAVAGQVVEFAPRRRRIAPLAYASGLVAAAACIALVLVNRSGNGASPQGGAALAVATAELPVKAATTVSKVQPDRPALQPAFKGLVHDAAIETAFTNADRAPLDWMNRVQFERVPAQELRFESLQTAPVDDLMFRSRPVFQTRVEGAAFRFQK